MLRLMVKTFLVSQKKNDKIAYENITKIATCQGDDYTNLLLLDYPYFIENHKMIAINLR